MNKTKTRFLEAIDGKRRGADMTHAAMADLVGMRQPHWASVRNGDRKITRKALRQIRRMWPELSPLVNAYIAVEVLGESDN